eukprot:1839780-Pyramimonas_sp.AAC.1
MRRSGIPREAECEDEGAVGMLEGGYRRCPLSVAGSSQPWLRLPCLPLRAAEASRSSPVPGRPALLQSSVAWPCACGRNRREVCAGGRENG